MKTFKLNYKIFMKYIYCGDKFDYYMISSYEFIGESQHRYVLLIKKK